MRREHRHQRSHEEELKKAQAEIAAGLNVKVEYFVSDMTDRKAVKKLAKDVLAKFGRCDVLFNNAGSNKPKRCRTPPRKPGTTSSS